MKKMLIAVSVLMMASVAKADLLDQINATLIDHVETTTEFTTHGRTEISLLSSVVQIGSFENHYLAALDLGIKGDTAPEPGQRTGINYTAGVKLHLAPLIRKYVKFNDNWSFLNAIELNPRYSYDFTTKRPTLGIGVGLAFGLQPK